MLEGTLGVDKLSATGTKDATTFLRGDNTFAAPAVPAGNSPTFAVQKQSSDYQTSVTDDVYTKVTYTDVISDVDSCYSSNEFEAPSAGLYYFYANVTLLGDGSTSSLAYVTLFYKNGSALDNYRSVYQDDNPESAQAQIPIMGVISLAQGDKVCVYAKCNTSAGVVQFKDGAFGGFKLA